ncbi:MAG: TonB-dependent receptor [bacterium]|nr:TonB-dependent receptor [bacterium]
MTALSLVLALATISGTVVLPDGTPAPSATVVVHGNGSDERFMAIADEIGGFTIDASIDPPWILRAEYPGFSAAVVSLDQLSESPVELRLTPPAFSALTEVVAPAPTSPRQRVARSQLTTRGNVLDALESTTPIGRVGAGGTGDTPSIRGLARRRVATYVDGARLPGFRRVGTSLEAIDPLLLEEASVESGGRSAMTGSEAIGGTLEVRTLEPRRSPLVVAQGNSAAREFAVLAAIPVVTKDSTQVQIAASTRQADDIRTPLGTMYPSAYKRGNIAVSAAGRTNAGTWSGRLLVARLADVGRPRWQREDRPTFVPDSSLGRLALSWWGVPPDWLGGNSFEITTTGGRRAETTTRFQSGVETQRSEASAYDFQTHAATNWATGHHHFATAVDISAVLDQNWRVRDSGVTSLPLEDGSVWSTSLVFSDRIDLEQGWEVDIAARGDFIRDGATTPDGDQSRSFQAFTGRLDADRRFSNGTSFRAAISRSFRAPSLDERYYTGPTGRGSINGNPDLEPETGLTVEGGVAWKSSNWTTSLTVYYTRLTRPIERIEYEDDLYTWINSDDAAVYGAEAVFSATVAKLWKLDASFGWNRGSTDEGSPLADIPAARASISAERQGDRYRFGGRALLATSKSDPGPSEVTREAWHRVDLWASVDFASAMSLRFEVTNLLDAEIWPSADRLAIPAAERSFGLTLIWKPGAPSDER